MKRKIYKLLSSAREGSFALALTVFSGTAYSQATYTFNYTGSTQTINLQAGNYDIEIWGADGGGTTGSNINAAVAKVGGKGGYAKGTLTISAATTASVYVGGKGNTEGVNVPGGFNGGGNSGGGTGPSGVCGSGGGASDIRVGGNTFSDRKIVAGGGGAAGYQECNGIAGAISGGHGGGTIGGDPLVGAYAARIGHGGTQTAGGAGGTDATYVAGNAGSFGLGANGGIVNVGSGNGAGGGGGWYGGGSGSNGFYCAGGGGGGSSYIGGVTSGTTIMFGQTGFVTNPDVTGNGLVLITELCNISLTASGNNSLNPVICSGQSLTLSTNAISNYVWSTGASTSSLVVAPTTSTVYYLTATSPSNCTASKSISVTVSSGQPTLSVVSSTNQTCLGKTATLTASGAVNYTWTNGVTNGVSFYPSVTTTYTVTGDNGCGITTALATISVSPLPLSVVSSATAVCTNNTTTLSATAAATSYTWQPGNIIGSSANLIVNPQATTNYTISASDGTCSGVANISLIANPVPTITSTSSSSLVCPGGTINLTASGGNSYTWTPVNMTGSNIVVSPIASSAYNVVGDNNFGCLGNSSQVVVVGVQPTLTLGSNNVLICNGSSATLTASGAHSYSWTGGPATYSYMVSPTQNTVYTVVGTHSSSGCTDTETVPVDVFDPVITIAGNSTICSGDAANLTASAPGAASYVWNPGPLPFPVISVSPLATTVYTVSTTSFTQTVGCPITNTIQVTVNPNPVITTTNSIPAICAKETNTYTASGANTYTWVNVLGTTVSPTITVTSNVAAVIIYTVTGENTMGCRSESVIPVSIHACAGVEQFTALSNQLRVYPNPNNGEFVVRAEIESSLNLINELGQVIKQIQLNEKNNYSASITQVPSGIYFIVGENFSKKIIVTK